MLEIVVAIIIFITRCNCDVAHLKCLQG